MFLILLNIVKAISSLSTFLQFDPRSYYEIFLINIFVIFFPVTWNTNVLSIFASGSQFPHIHTHFKNDTYKNTGPRVLRMLYILVHCIDCSWFFHQLTSWNPIHKNAEAENTPIPMSKNYKITKKLEISIKLNNSKSYVQISESLFKIMILVQLLRPLLPLRSARVLHWFPLFLLFPSSTFSPHEVFSKISTEGTDYSSLRLTKDLFHDLKISEWP